MPTLNAPIAEETLLEREELPNGVYTFRVMSAEVVPSAKGSDPSLACEVEIMSGPDGAKDTSRWNGPLYGGKKKLWIWLGESFRWKLKRFCVACGLTSEETKNPASEMFIGKKFKCPIEPSTYTNKETGVTRATQDFGEFLVAGK